MGTTCAKGVNGAVSPSHPAITVQEYSNNNNNNNNNDKNNSSNNHNKNNQDNNKKGVVRIQDKNALYRGTTITTNTTNTPITHVHANIGAMAFIEEEDALSVPSVHITPAASRIEPSPPLLSLTLSKQQLQRKNGIRIFSRDAGVKKRSEVAAHPAMISENDMAATFNRREWMQRRRMGNIATTTNTTNANTNTTAKKNRDSITVLTTTPLTTTTKVTKVPCKRFVDVGNEYQPSIVDNTSKSSSSSSSSSSTTSTENFTELSTSVPFVKKTNGVSLSSPLSTRRLPQFANTTVRRSGSIQHISPVFVNAIEERKRGVSTVKSRGSGSEISLVPSRRKNPTNSRLLPPNLVPSPSVVERVLETSNVKEQPEEEEKEKILPQLTSESKCSGRGNTQMNSSTGLDDGRLFTPSDSNEGTLHTALTFRQRSSPDTVKSGEEVLPLSSETIPVTGQSIFTEQTLQKRGIGNVFPIESPLEVVTENEKEKAKGRENGLLDSSYVVNDSYFSTEEIEREEGNKKTKEEWSSVNSLNKSRSTEAKKKGGKKKIDLSLDLQRRAIEEVRTRTGQKYNEMNNKLKTGNNIQKGTGNSHYISRSLPRSKSCEGLVISSPVIHTDNAFLRSFSYQRSVEESHNTSRNMEFSSFNGHFTVNTRHPGRLSNRLVSPSPLVSPLVSPRPLSSITRTSSIRILPTRTGKRENNEKNCLVQSCRSISPPPHQPTNVFPSRDRLIYSPTMETISRTTTKTTGGSLGPTTTTNTTSSRDRNLGKRGAKYICQWCGGPYELYEVCRIKREPHASIRLQRKHEKEVKKRAQSLLRSGRVQEAVIELQRASLI
ncbi:hypothetical protein LSM04_008326 [Trypanosoma melophagium]|uniref:uncharacterized protein n=1 Tax=Trypanosoma melophagium TaxID=715481 RepID=UPI00351AA56A|nr:hypothetical protein LSM04_008326 [Trypanosoma melophagium]